MANPPPFIPGFSYTGYQAVNPSDPLPGPMVDNDFANVSDSINTTITALSSVRRSDGALVNGIVTPESLSSDLLIGVQTPTAWVTAHAYVAGNIVVQSNKFYLCLVAHTSGVFATDLAAVKWVEVTLSISGYSADQIAYDHTISGLLAVNIKTALDEIDADVDALQAQHMTSQTFTATGTWTKPAGCRFAIFEGVASGGAGGGVTGLAGATNAGAGGGGGSGRYGQTALIDVSGIATAAIVIGAAGVGVSSGNGGTGGDMTATVNAVVYTWNGGTGGTKATLNGSTCLFALPGAGGAGVNLQSGSGSAGTVGMSNGPDQVAVGGTGGSSPLGNGAYPVLRSTNGVTAGGLANNFGAGGGGAVGCNSASNAAGGNGAGGFLRVWEFY